MTTPDHGQSPEDPTPQAQTPPEQGRPADSDREQVAERLREAVGEGRLDLTEYDERVRTCYAAGTIAELHRVLADLPAPPPAPEPVLIELGEIRVTQSTAFTPTGAIPLRGSQWIVQDRWLSEQKTPSWAIVLAILLFFCVGPFSLLFLLAKETRFHGTVDVTVTGGTQQYVVRAPVHSQQQVYHLYHRVNYVRHLAAS